MGFFDKARSQLAKIISGTPENTRRYASGRGSATSEIGAPGTSMYGGYSSADYNSEFNGKSAIDKYEEMRKTDATVNATINAIKLPILQAEYFVMPVDANDPKSVEQAEFVRKNLDGIDGGFRNWLNEATNYKVFGFYYFEKVYRIKDGKVFLWKLAPRLPSAHAKWEMESDRKTPGITQLLPTPPQGSENESTSREIPMSKLVLLTNNREGDNFEGVSILRSAYKHWYIKDLLYKIDGIKHERGAGILMIRTPDGNSEEDIAKAEELGTRFKVNENAFIVVPGSKESGWEVDLMTKGIADQTTALLESVKHHDRAISANILAQFIDLGSSGAGSYALSKDQTDFFTLSLQSSADYIAECLTKQLIEELVIMNFGEQEEYPRFVFGQIGSIDYKEMSEALEKLVATGLVKVDGKMVEWTHKTYGLPEVKAEDIDNEADEADEAMTPEDAEPDEDMPAEDMPKKKMPTKKPVAGKKPSADAPEEKTATDGSLPNSKPAQKKSELSEGKYFRDLTFAETRVKLSDVETYFDDEEASLENQLNALNEERKQALIKKAEKIIDGGDIAAIAALLIGLGATARAILKDAATRALERGKATAAQEIKESIPTTSKFTKKVIDAKIDLALDGQASALEAAIKGRLVDLMNNDVGKAAAISEIERMFDDITDADIQQIIGRTVVDFFDEGRALTFEKNREKIHALQRSEILDDKTCTMCMSLDGRVLGANDPFTKVGQIHTHCRGMWVSIMKTDTELPKIKQLPQTIKNRFMTTEGVPATNSFKQLKQPLVKKGSRLEKAIKDGTVEIKK